MYTRFRLVPKSMTLDDLEGPLRTLFQNTLKQNTVITTPLSQTLEAYPGLTLALSSPTPAIKA